MKRSFVVVALTGLGAWSVLGQTPASTPEPPATALVISEKGPNHRTYQKLSWETNEIGEVVVHTNAAFTELTTGMNYLKNGQWVESTPDIELLADGAAATNSAHTVIFAANLNTIGAIDLTLPGGKHLRSRIAAMSYSDPSTGKAVVIAQPKDSIGLLIGSDQVLYTNAFDVVEADVQFVNTQAGLEQNIIWRAQPPAPGEFGLNPDTTWLQVLTEFTDPPVPIKTVDAGGFDGVLDFDQMTIAQGKAFMIGVAGRTSEPISVSKQ